MSSDRTRFEWVDALVGMSALITTEVSALRVLYEHGLLESSR